MIFHLFALLVVSVPVLAQVANPQPLLVGTWSSGSKNVVTGAGFAQPANASFIYPPTTGISYSFTSDGFYEIARYRFNGNATEPKCITGVMNWVHGTYAVQANGSIITTPFGDGYQQIQDPCAAVTNFVENYNATELYQMYQIFQDPVDGYKLHMFQFDGSPLAPQFQVSSTPNMLPTRMLRNVTAPVTTTNGFTTSKRKRSAGEKRWSQANAGLIVATSITIWIGSIVGPLLL